MDFKMKTLNIIKMLSKKRNFFLGGYNFSIKIYVQAGKNKILKIIITFEYSFLTYN